mmetsp:Transcript_25872/g.43133  ORF Transcript_25872/g.43133 Transcript_25872/m.43133 type:complete len:224 (-) Transcript_25872:709-1380(-)
MVEISCICATTDTTDTTNIVAEHAVRLAGARLAVDDRGGIESVDEVHHQPPRRAVVGVALADAIREHCVEGELAQTHVGSDGHHPTGHGVNRLHTGHHPFTTAAGAICSCCCRRSHASILPTHSCCSGSLLLLLFGILGAQKLRNLAACIEGCAALRLIVSGASRISSTSTDATAAAVVLLHAILFIPRLSCDVCSPLGRYSRFSQSRDSGTCCIRGGFFIGA